MPMSNGIYYFIHPKEETNLIPVVLIHGAGGTHLFWPAEIRRLPGYRMYAVDLPGHGKSQGMAQQSILGYVAGIKDWLDQIGVEKAVFAGHSMGGAIALTVALEHSQRVQALVLVGTGARLKVHPDILAASASQTNFLAAMKLVTEWSFGAQAPARLVELAGKRMSEIQPANFYSDLLACDGFDITNRLGEIDKPALVICGEEDRMTPVKYAQFLADHIKGARLETIPGCGHMVMLEKPDEVKMVLQRFLGKVCSHELDWTKG